MSQSRRCGKCNHYVNIISSILPSNWPQTDIKCVVIFDEFLTGNTPARMSRATLIIYQILLIVTVANVFYIIAEHCQVPASITLFSRTMTIISFAKKNLTALFV